MPDTTLLFDGNHLMHRVSHLKELEGLTTRDGTPTGAVMGFLRAIHGSVVRFEPTRIIVVWDDSHSERRKKLLPAYKVRAEPKTEKDKLELAERIRKWNIQKPLLKELLPKLAIRQLQIPGYEGDDALELLCRDLQGKTIIVSEDKDLFQLVEENISIYRPIRDELVSFDNVSEHMGVVRDGFVFLKAIVGDDSDCIPGVPGVGPVTASKLLNEAQKMFDGGDWTPRLVKKLAAGALDKRTQKIAEQWEVVERNLELVDLRKVEASPEARGMVESVLSTDKSGMAPDLALIREFQRLEMESILSMFGTWIVPFRRLT
jgi:5'-3' exonuclease